MKHKFVDVYMDMAKRFAQLSSAKRLQVGSIIVKDDRIISIGYNGMPSGWTNECEIELYDAYGRFELITKPEVIHAEANAIAKLAKSTESGHDATMFLTHSPCVECAKMIYTAGITKVVYGEDYRDNSGVVFLQQCNIKVDKYSK
jgi:dCMP deaminase